MAEHLVRYKVDMLVFLMVDQMGLKDWWMVLHLVLMAVLSAALRELWVYTSVGRKDAYWDITMADCSVRYKVERKDKLLDSRLVGK